jgi:hypothetical protein
MGARVNFIFDDGTNNLVALYSHWGADSWQEDLDKAMIHASPRLGDYSYWTRMVISHLIKDHILDETGFGIFAINRSEMASLDNWAENVVIDCTTASFEYNGVYGRVWV